MSYRGNDTEDDLAAWRDYLRTVRVDFPIHRQSFSANLAVGQIWISMRDVWSTDVHTGERRPEYRSQHAPTPRPDASTAKWLRDQFLAYVTHELDEHFWVGVDRPHDPHARDGLPP